MFSGCTVPPDIKETELGSIDQKVFPSADKNTGMVLVSFYTYECCPTPISIGVDILRFLVVICWKR